MKQFNKEQMVAVRHRDGPMLVLAGPGSGKTQVIAGRLVSLIEREGIDPHTILVLTFSRAAAVSMKERFHKTAHFSYPVTFGTFHSVFYHIVKSQGYYRSHDILTENKKLIILKKLINDKRLGYSSDKERMLRMLELISYKKTDNKRMLDKTDDIEKEHLEILYPEYVRMCRNESCIDFDDMINECRKAFVSNAKILNKWREKYKYILVDEIQDIDNRQYEVLSLLAGREGNLFCVGDDDQSIYSFRGADPGIMRKMTQDHKSIRIVRLKNNYRCPKQIIVHAGQLINRNHLRFKKDQVCVNDSEKGCLEYKCVRTRREEAKLCLDIIGKLREMPGQERDSIGILYRISSEADILETMLKNSSIPYTRKDSGADFYKREWIRDIIAYIRLASEYNKDDALRILNRPDRGLLRESIMDDTRGLRGLLNYYNIPSSERDSCIRLIKQIDFIKSLNPYAALNYVLKGIGMEEYIKKRYALTDEYEDGIEELTLRAQIFSSLKEWTDHIDTGNEQADESQMPVPSENGPGITLMTIHSSKGLEFDNVIMTGLQEGVFPGKKCVNEDELEEERRLFYVAMTRCRKRLWLIGMRKDEYGKTESRFIKEAGLSNETVGSILDTVV